MAIYESLDFCYDGRFSYDLGLINVRVEDGMYDEPFGSTRTIQEVKVRGWHKPHFQFVDTEPLEFELEFAFLGAYDDNKLREVARWLTPSYYKPLYFLNNPDRIYYCMPVEDIRFIHNGLKQGYIKLKMRCDGSYAYSPYYTTDEIDTTEQSSFVIDNLGDLPIRPEIGITKIGDGDISIINTTNSGKEFKFVSLKNDEVIYVDNHWEHIETNLVNIFRYTNFNNNWLELVTGRNVFNVTGGAKIMVRYQFMFI